MVLLREIIIIFPPPGGIDFFLLFFCSHGRFPLRRRSNSLFFQPKGYVLLCNRVTFPYNWLPKVGAGTSFVALFPSRRGAPRSRHVFFLLLLL